ncbi:MAG: M56 family metallopeptidase [Pirellulales bacterium]|nr:M56 family metallopeptidase [Pirellulales bacterium]
MTFEAISTWSSVWSHWIVSNVWQSTLLTLLIWGMAGLLRRSSPSVRYWLWQIVAIKLLLIPFWTLPLPGEWLPAWWSDKAITRESMSQATLLEPVTTIQPASGAGTSSVSSTPSSQTLRMTADTLEAERTIHWTTWLMFAWLFVVAAQFLVLIVQRVRLSRLLRDCLPAPADVQSLVASSAARLNLAPVPQALVTELDCSPFVCGIWRPVLVLPQGLQSMLADSELEPVLMHELAHVRRRDLLWNWLPQLARMLFFFHPIAYWASFRIRLEAELACDGLAMNTTGKSVSQYAELLVRVVSRLSEPSLLRSSSVASAGLSGQFAHRTNQEDR